METAIEECKAYIRIGALTDAMIEEIAFDNDVDPDALKAALGWE